MTDSHCTTARCLWALSITLSLGGAAAACGGGGNGGSLDGNCQTACNKIAAACAISAADCVSSCEDTSGFSESCLPYAEATTQCAATTGTVTCLSGGQYEIDGCTSQAEALSDCTNGSGSTGGTTGTSGGSTGSSGNSGNGPSTSNCDADGTWGVDFQWSGRTPDTLTLDISGTSVDQLSGPGVGAATGTISVNGEQLTWTLSDGSTWTGNAGANCTDITAGTMVSSAGILGSFTAVKGGGSGASGGSSCATPSSSATCGAGTVACDSSHCCPSATPYGCVSLLECYATADEALAACGSACLVCGS
jgi:hypothetical protein